ncbi:hypothetical protein ACJMK2_036231 [Sinanodonta woodiana]|uniref:Uncharacterized protein n=1 Tax=Sinanodonta woodiana TaxID=1069815 RepID=A0ABD3WGU9_SINWO
MASIFISTNEATNFARMCWIVVDVFRDILWRVLVDEISPADLPSKVRTNQHNLRNLNKDIKMWLCNSSSASPIIPTSKDFDVTSLYTLIRNLCNLVPVPTNGWGKAPPPTGGNIGDDVERLRVFRNSVYGHAKEGYVSTIDFSDLCREMKTFVTSLDAFFGGNCDFVGRIDSILTCNMDKALQDTYIDKMQKIAKLSESIETRKEWDSLRKERKTVVNEMEQQRIIDSSQRILQQHRCHAEKNFVQTRAYIHANEILRQHRRLIITGKSGQGKSYMANQLLMKIIADDPNIKPLILTTVEQWKSLIDVSVRFGIVVDDMCGKICLNEGELMKWREESTYMLTLIENGRHVVIFTMKSYFNEQILVTMQSCPLFSTEIIMNLDNTKLKFAEKIVLANIYFKEYGLSADELSTLCKTDEAAVGFPQLCRAAEMIKDKSKLFRLFSKPREIILEQINHFRLDDKMTYGCLVLVLLSKGKLNLKSIRELANDRTKKNNIALSIFFSCGIPDVVPLKVLHILRSLQGTYLSFDSSEDSYYFGHDSMEDAVFCSYLEFFPEETLLYCPLELVCKRCTIMYDSNDIQKESQDNILYLHPSCQAHLINRIITTLRECNPTDFRIVSEANIWTCKNFTKDFLAEFKEIHLIADIENNSLLVHAANANNRDLVEKLLHELDNIPEDKKKNVAHFLTKSAQASCAHKDTYLIEKICKDGRVDVNNILPNSIQHGSVDAIKFLLETGADIKYRSKNGENLLHIACLQGRLDLVQFLHSKEPNLVNELDGDDRSVFLSVASGGSVEILEFLLTLGLNPMGTDQTGWNLLHYACLHANKAMAEHLAGKYSKLIYNDTDEGFSVLMCAALGGSVHIFSRMHQLMKTSLSVDKNCYTTITNDVHNMTRKTNDQRTLLHLSCLQGCLEMTKYLEQTYPTMIHEVDNMKKTPAHCAAYSGNIAVLSYLIDCGADPWCKTSHEETLLHIACLNGHLEIVKHLLKTYPSMLHELDNMRRTPAHYVAHSGNIALLSHLIECGTDPWCKSYEEETLLHSACIGGRIEMSKYLLQNYPTMLNQVDNKRRTPAFHAAESGNIALFSYLVECGIDPWYKAYQEQTLLHSACIKGQLEISKHLVETYPTMLHEVDNIKSTPAHYAAESGNIALVNYLIDCGTDPYCKTTQAETLLHTASLCDHLEMSKSLVQSYPSMLHEEDILGNTPAHYASNGGNIALLNYLIDCGLDPWCKSFQEETLLHLACLGGQLEIVKKLVHTYPTMLHEVDIMMRTPAHYAVESGTIPLLSYLIDCGTDPWCKTSQDETLLHRSCIAGQTEMSKYLVQTYPTMLHEMDIMMRTPAHYAAESGTIALLSYLIDSGTDPWSKTAQDETLLHLACIKGKLEMSKHLEQTYPSMLHEVTNMKITPAHYAAKSGNIALLNYLIDCGADPLCKTAQEENLLHIACLNGHLEIGRHLVLTYPKMIHEVDKMRRTPAHNVAQKGNIALLSYLIDCGTDPWCKTSQEETLLHIACHGGRLEMSEHLVKNYPTMLHEVDIIMRTPAHCAAESDDIALLSYLIDCGIDPWCKTAQEDTLLHRSCITGQTEMSKYLVQTYPTMLHQVNNMMRTPAFHVAQNGNIALLTYLIDCGTDMLCKASQEETLLQVACLCGQLEIVKHLVHLYPTMLHEVDIMMRTPAHYAAESGNIALLSYLIDSDTNPWSKTAQDETLLHLACIKGRLEMSKHLVQTYPSMLHEVDNMERTPAHYAAESGNIALLSYLIDCGTNPWCETSEDETLLHKACLRGHIEMSKYLVQTYPAMLHQVNNMKWTPAHYAAYRGYIALVSYLIECGTDPWCKTAQEETLLHKACIAGQLEMSKYLVQTYPSMLHEVDNMKNTPAMCAIFSGNVALLSYLIECGTDPCCKTWQEETLLHIACLSDQLEIVIYLLQTYPTMLHEVDNMRSTPAHCAAAIGNIAMLSYLIDCGTDPWCTTAKEETLLHRACINGMLEMSIHLIQTYPTMLLEVDIMKNTPVSFAADSGTIALLSYLIDFGTDPWCKGYEGENLLHRACLGGHIEMSKYLVKTYPAMLHEVDYSKNTPAHYAMFSGNIALLSYLIECGTDPCCKTSQEETLLHIACLSGQLEIVIYLLQTYPTMLHEVDNMRRTPVHCAAASGNIALLSYLIDSGTDPWSTTAEEETLLHVACFKGMLEMSLQLIQTYPSMLHQVDKKKRTPAHCAAESDSIDLLSYLIDCGTDPWCKTSQEETLLHKACLGGHIEMSRHLVQRYPTMLHQVDNMNNTPAHYAADRGNIALLIYLIECGTDPWCKTSEEETLLHMACLNGQLEMSKHLVQMFPTMIHEVDNMRRTPAHNVAHNGNIALLRYLIDCGTDPWCKTSQEETLLHRACLCGQIEMSKYLVNTFPTMLHQVNCSRSTPAHYAAASGNIALLSYLIDCGTDPWCKTSQEETLLHRACLGGHMEMSKHLVQTYPTMLNQSNNIKCTPVHYAADIGNISLLSNLIDCGTDPWCKTSQEDTILHRACLGGHLEMSKYLVQTYPTMLRQVNNMKSTPAHHAAESGNIALLSYLIDCGTDPWCRTSQEDTILHRACIGGHLEMSKHLVQTYHTMLHQVNSKNNTPAHYAAHSGNIALLSYLIDFGTDPWCKTSEEDTLLHIACLSGQLEMSKHLVKAYPSMIYEVDNTKRTPAHIVSFNGNIALLSYLIECGTDPWCKTSQEETLLHMACRGGHIEMSKYLLNTYPTMLYQVNNMKNTPAHYSAYSGNIAFVSYLINSGTDPWCKNSQEETLLHRACLGGHIEMSKYLLQTYPSMLHQVNNMKCTPAHFAAESGNIALLSYLIDCGTDPWCKTSQEETLLHRACLRGHIEMSKYLVNTFPSMLHQVSSLRSTPAHYAADSGKIALLSYLTDCDTDPWCRTSQEDTILHRACLSGHLEMSKYLVQTYPTMLRQVNNMKSTPIHYAAENGNIALLSYLIDCGTDPWCKTSQEDTILHRACLGGHLEMSKHLVQTFPTILHQVNSKMNTPAHYAAQSGNIALLSYLIDFGTDPWCKTSEEDTLLHIACLSGQLEMSKHLVKAYPSMIHEVDNMKKTPAHIVSFNGNIALLSYLIECGTDPWCKTSQEETLLHMACRGGHIEMSKYLLNTYPTMLYRVTTMKCTPAHYSASSGNIALLSYLINSGTDPWCKTSQEETLLHRACLGGHIEMSKYLVQTYSSMLHQVNNMKCTPAHYAAESGNVALLSYLIDCGTNPWCKTSHEETLLHIACLSGQLEMSEYLASTYPTMLHEVDYMKRTPTKCFAVSRSAINLEYLSGYTENEAPYAYLEKRKDRRGQRKKLCCHLM